MAYVRRKEGSKQEIAYKKIKQAIIDNKFAPDTLLVEDILCNMLGFSKTPIREALRRLNSEGFVETIPEKGTYVSRITIDEVNQMYDVREVLEGLAVRLCALKKDETVINNLEKIMCEWKMHLDNMENLDSVNYDMQFHNLIINGCSNLKLKNSLEPMIQQIRRFATITIDDIDRLRASFQEHEKVFILIRNGNGSDAETHMREHIRDVKEYQIRRHFSLDYSFNKI